MDSFDLRPGTTGFGRLPLIRDCVKLYHSLLQGIILAISYGGVEARLGDSLSHLKETLGQPSVEMKTRATYGWLVDEEQRVFLNVICDGSQPNHGK